MAEETSVGTLMVIKDDLIVKPVPSLVIVDVSNKTRTNEGTTEVCAFDILCRNEPTKREVSTELLDISRQWIPQGFLRLAEEAKFVGVGNTPSGMMTEIQPEIAEVTGLTSDSISWKIEEDSEESAVSLDEVMQEVTSIRFDVGQLMRWPDGTYTLDKLYDLPESIQDVMGLQAVRPSVAVCKVMTVPDSNCVRIVTPDDRFS